MSTRSTSDEAETAAAGLVDDLAKIALWILPAVAIAAIDRNKPEMSAPSSKLSPERSLELFRFYEAAAESAKGRAWAVTTWILALNAGLFAFAVDFFTKSSSHPKFWLIETVSGGVGIVLCLFLIYMLLETGSHIKTYWTHSNKIAANDPSLEPFIGWEAAKVKRLGEMYSAGFPQFCRNLALLAAAFALAHAAAAYLLVQHGVPQPSLVQLGSSMTLWPDPASWPR